MLCSSINSESIIKAFSNQTWETFRNFPWKNSNQGENCTAFKLWNVSIQTLHMIPHKVKYLTVYFCFAKVVFIVRFIRGYTDILFDLFHRHLWIYFSMINIM